MRRIGALVGLILLGGIVCGAAAAASIVLLWAAFWGPFFAQLLDRSIRVHDVGAALLAYYALGFVGAMSFATTAISLLAILFVRHAGLRRAVHLYRQRGAGHRDGRAGQSAPDGRGADPHPVWSYPLAEVAILLIGFGWAWWLQRSAPRWLNVVTGRASI